MPRRAPWPCWHRPALRSVNQTLRPPPSWAPPAARGTRSPAAGHPSPAWSSGSTVPPWMTSVASNPTTKALETVAGRESPAAAPTTPAAAAIKSGSGYPTITSTLMGTQPLASSRIRPTLLHPAPEPPHQDTLSSSLTNRASLLVDSHTPRLWMETPHMSGAVRPARAAITITQKRTRT